MAQTSSNSCSAGGVFGREGATDSAARRTIVEGKVVVKGKESAEFSVQILGENMYGVLERNHTFLNFESWVR